MAIRNPLVAPAANLFTLTTRSDGGAADLYEATGYDLAPVTPLWEGIAQGRASSAQ